VLPSRSVDVVEHRRERCRLPRSGGARGEDEPAVLLGEAADARREFQLLEARHLLRDDAERERGRAALSETVHAEPREVAALVRDVEVAVLAEVLEPLRHACRNAPKHGLEVVVGEVRVDIERHQRPVVPKHGRPPHLQVDVGGAEGNGAVQESIEIHLGPSPIGSAARVLEVSP
jgi:hypothetical protein